MLWWVCRVCLIGFNVGVTMTVLRCGETRALHAIFSYICHILSTSISSSKLYEIKLLCWDLRRCALTKKLFRKGTLIIFLSILWMRLGVAIHGVIIFCRLRSFYLFMQMLKTVKTLLECQLSKKKKEKFTKMEKWVKKMVVWMEVAEAKLMERTFNVV